MTPSSRVLVIGITTHRAPMDTRWRGSHGATSHGTSSRKTPKEDLNLSPDSKIPLSAAERMRAYRRRRRRGFRCVEVHVGHAELDGLVAKGYLPPDKRQDVHAIKSAVNDLIFDWLQQT